MRLTRKVSTDLHSQPCAYLFEYSGLRIKGCQPKDFVMKRENSVKRKTEHGWFEFYKLSWLDRGEHTGTYKPKKSALSSIGDVKDQLLTGGAVDIWPWEKTSDHWKRFKTIVDGNGTFQIDIFSVKTAKKCHFICILWEQMDFDIIDVSSKNLHWWAI